MKLCEHKMERYNPQDILALKKKKKKWNMEVVNWWKIVLRSNCFDFQKQPEVGLKIEAKSDLKWIFWDQERCYRMVNSFFRISNFFLRLVWLTILAEKV